MNKLLSLALFLFLAMPAYSQVRDLDNEDYEEEKPSAKDTDDDGDKPYKFKDHLVVGGNFGVGFSNGWYLNISPRVGYRLFDGFILGVGGTYVLSQIKYGNFNITNHVYGGAVFARYAPFVKMDIDFLSNLYLHTEFEQLWFKQNQNGFEYSGPTSPGFFVGGGYSTNFGKGAGFTVDVLYNILWVDCNNPAADRCSPYSSPLVIRAGFTYGL